MRIFGSGFAWLVRYLENLRQNDQEILNKGGWGRAKRAPSDCTLSTVGSLCGAPATHTFGNLFGSGLAGFRVYIMKRAFRKMLISVKTSSLA
uniref:Uncharacterized protein n=1 Tax=Candidatus Kentrum sp. UNK TaxID=2126344 RepID=A0A451ABH0_9GAMM|nr:MAG: hypothetical protein BECKUNK1418G_GA0071005_10333 [Candidatus Kentron sp. UNK]